MDNPLSTIPGAIIGYRKNGTPIRLIAGASPEGEPPEGDPPADTAAQLAAALADAEKWKALSRKHEANAKANADKATRLDQIEAEHAAALAKVTDERDKLSGEVTNLRAVEIRAVAAAAAGLPADLAAFITATTAEDAKTQAETLAARLGTPGHDQGVRKDTDTDPGTGVARLRAAYADRSATR
ncbi:hypothetical protein [Catellatospora sp. NPDC049609]|uniref:hypothetical protein n=1 Tax=Catellatospora sp. NPDC049609 TaxID=3155505 RepID=UPI003417B6B2